MTDDPLEYFEEEILPEVEDLDFEAKGVFTPEDLQNYGVELLTEETEELRSYDMDYQEFSFPMSVELGTFEGDRSLGISAEAGNRLQDEAIVGLVSEIADAYDTSRRTLGHGEYILDIEDW